METKRTLRKQIIGSSSPLYIHISIVRKTLKFDQSIYTILQILSVTLFEKSPIYQALSNTGYNLEGANISNPLNLYD